MVSDESNGSRQASVIRNELLEYVTNGTRNITINHIDQKHANPTAVHPEVRSAIDTTNAIATVAKLGLRIAGGEGIKVVKDLLKIIFGEEPPPITTCDSYYVHRAKLAETILRSTQSSKGSYLVYDPTSKYYKTIMYGPLLAKMAPVPPGFVYVDGSYTTSDALTSEEAKEHCETTIPDSPVMEKLIEMLMDAPFMPPKVKEAYKMAKEVGDYKYGREVVKLIGRGIQVLMSLKVENPSTDQLHNMVDKNLNRLNKIAENKLPAEERKLILHFDKVYIIFIFILAIGPKLEGILAEQNKVKPKKGKVVIEPFSSRNETKSPFFGV